MTENHESALGIDETTTALFGYLVVFVTLILVFVEKKNKFVRFNAFQSLLFAAASVLLLVAYLVVVETVAYAALAVESQTMAYVLEMLTLISPVGTLAWFAVLLIVAYRAYNGRYYRLPVTGGLAEKWSN